MKHIFIILFLSSTFLASAQNVSRDTIIDDKILIEGDSIMFTLDDVMVLSKLKFDSTKEQRYYYWYWKKVNNAYPFAKLAAER